MSTPSPDELISAYLDGELTAEEQAHVEQLLRENAVLRRLCDQLRTLRFKLQSMPTASPPEDLVQRVLRQAERRMLIGDQPSEPGTSHDTDVAKGAPEPVTTPLESSTRNWRLVGGALLTAAALLTVAVLLFEPARFLEDQTDVALSSSATGSLDPADTASETTEELALAIAPEIAAENAEGAVAADEPAAAHEPVAKMKLGQPSHAGVDMTADVLEEDTLKRSRRATDKLVVGNSQGVHAAEAEERAPAGGPQRAGKLALDATDSGEGKAPNSGRPFGEWNENAGGGAVAGPGGMGGMGGGGGLGDTSLADGIAPARTRPAPNRPAAPAPPYGGKVEDSATGAASNLAESVERNLNLQTELVSTLTRQLDQHETLLVQVTMPVTVESRLFSLPEAPNRTAGAKLGETAGRLLALDDHTRVKLLKETEDIDHFYFQAERPPGDVILIEGARDELRKSLQQLVNRKDIQVRTVSAQHSQSGEFGAFAPEHSTMPSGSAGSGLARDKAAGSKHRGLGAKSLAETGSYAENQMGYGGVEDAYGSGYGLTEGESGGDGDEAGKIQSDSYGRSYRNSRYQNAKRENVASTGVEGQAQKGQPTGDDSAPSRQEGAKLAPGTAAARQLQRSPTQQLRKDAEGEPQPAAKPSEPKSAAEAKLRKKETRNRESMQSAGDAKSRSALVDVETQPKSPALQTPKQQTTVVHLLFRVTSAPTATDPPD